MPKRPRSISNRAASCLRQPNRLFSDSAVSSSDSLSRWNSKLVLKRRLHTSRVTASTSTVPGTGDATGTSATMLDTCGAPNRSPFAKNSGGVACRLRTLSSASSSSQRWPGASSSSRPRMSGRVVRWTAFRRWKYQSWRENTSWLMT